MIEKKLCEKILEKAMETGADYAEIYAEDKVTNTVEMIDSAVENAVTARSRGAGIRIFRDTRSIYAYGNGTDEASLLSLAEKVSRALSSDRQNGGELVLHARTYPRHCTIAVPAASVSVREKADMLRVGYLAAKNYSSYIAQVRGTITDNTKDVLVATSDGVYGQDRRSYVRVALNATATDGKENQSGHYSPGCHSGYEFIRSLDLKAGGEFAARQAVTMLLAKPCPSGKMPVIMGGGFGGVIFHEACGHSLEATAVAKGNSTFCGKLGEKIAHEKVTAYDDGTMPGEWGSLNMNDEGEPTQRILLIENGILRNYMIDKLGARRMKMKSTGSGRRESYAYAPTSRMTNTYIAAGSDTEKEIFDSVEDGLYAAHMGGGSVNPVTGEFNFSVQEGYLVKNGEIRDAVRGATLIGKGHEVLFNIDMVSDGMTLAQGMCGSESGSVPTNVGQPTIRISSLLVGGAC